MKNKIKNIFLLLATVILITATGTAVTVSHNVSARSKAKRVKIIHNHKHRHFRIKRHKAKKVRRHVTKRIKRTQNKYKGNSEFLKGEHDWYKVLHKLNTAAFIYNYKNGYSDDENSNIEVMEPDDYSPGLPDTKVEGDSRDQSKMNFYDCKYVPKGMRWINNKNLINKQYSKGLLLGAKKHNNKNYKGLSYLNTPYSSTMKGMLLFADSYHKYGNSPRHKEEWLNGFEDGTQGCSDYYDPLFDTSKPYQIAYNLTYEIH